MVKYLFFSKDRPLQLELTLSTCKHFSTDWDEDYPVVLYKASTDRYQRAYDSLEGKFPGVKFVKEHHFMSDVKDILSSAEHILFSVDDCVFTNYFSTKEIVSLIEKHNSIGFSLRLGKNTTWCYPLSASNKIPLFGRVTDNIIKFDCRGNGFGDFYYPMELSSSLYKASDITRLLGKYLFSNPNTLESIMHTRRHSVEYKPTLMCFETSVAFSNPINKVQKVNNNRAGESISYSPEYLLEKYERGYKIDEAAFYGFVSNGCHQEVEIRIN